VGVDGDGDDDDDADVSQPDGLATPNRRRKRCSPSVLASRPSALALTQLGFFVRFPTKLAPRLTVALAGK
jgi:hypothetical protein